MPRGDGTGPMGLGPMTGAGAGRCAGYGAPGHGFGRAAVRRCRKTYDETGVPGWARYSGAAEYADEQELLTREADILGSRLEQVRRRLSGLSEKQNVSNEEDTKNPDENKQ